ncbi:MAG: hypothetical protein GEU71_02525 [Actinobacteria bacterium]|nr:hypothetical protein [Actinomycetota bacterium]
MRARVPFGTTFWILRLLPDERLTVCHGDGTHERSLRGFKQVTFVENTRDLDRLGPGMLAVALGTTGGKTIGSIERLAAKVAQREAAGLLVVGPPDEREVAHGFPAPTGDFPIFIKPRDLDWSAVLQPLLNLYPSITGAPNPEAARRRLLSKIIDRHGRVDIAEDQARHIGMDLNEQIRVIVVQPIREMEKADLDRLEEVVAVELLEHDPLSTTVTYEGAVVGTESTRTELSSPIPARLLFKARNAMPDAVVMVGVGMPHHRIDGIFRSFREARWAARVGGEASGPNSVIHFDDLGTTAWLEPFDFASDGQSSMAIEQLSAHDALHGTQLLQTLIAYIMSGRAKEAADHLFIHRNTLRYRLECIHKLTGLDPHQQGSRLVLDLQLRLATAQGVIPSLDAIKERQPTSATGDPS